MSVVIPIYVNNQYIRIFILLYYYNIVVLYIVIYIGESNLIWTL